jgi:hypothetical protein
LLLGIGATLTGAIFLVMKNPAAGGGDRFGCCAGSRAPMASAVTSSPDDVK